MNTNNVQLPKELILRICGFIERREDRWVVLALTRSRHGPSLTELELSQNRLGSEGAIELAGALQNVRSLIKLDLSWNSIGSEGCIALAGALQHVPSLIKLDLSANDIGSEASSH